MSIHFLHKRQYRVHSKQTLNERCFKCEKQWVEQEPVNLVIIHKHHEIKEYQEGISYGAHEVRDGVKIARRSLVKNLDTG
jgi:hypothetical protein